MQIEAIYDHGRLELPKHIRLRQQRFKVRLDIPESELIMQQGNSKETVLPVARQPSSNSYLEDMRAILAPVRKHLATTEKISLSKTELDELFCQEWEEQHHDLSR